MWLHRLDLTPLLAAPVYTHYVIRYRHNELPLKPAVIFTDLPTLQITRCIGKGKHATTVAAIAGGSAGPSATARAAWPQGFMLRTIWLGAQHVRLAPGT